MEGLMMDYPLTLTHILKRFKTYHADAEVVSQVGAERHRYTNADLYQRVVRLMNVLRQLGVKPGDRVATFAWNSYRHLELYYAIPALGAVMHTLNLRLSREQLQFIIRHAEDKLIFADASLLPLLEPLSGQIPSVERVVIMDDLGQGAPSTTLPQTEDYEALLRGASDQEDFPEFSENTACGLCYTSGTTGDPKGSLYSHRALFLMCMMCAMTDSMRIGEGDNILPVVPMFHANAWGTPYVAGLIGAKLVFTGRDMSPENITRLIREEQVSFALGVPTIWTALLQYLEANKLSLEPLRRTLVGGSPVPRAMVEAFDRLGVQLIQGWGMTEMSPLGSLSRVTRKMQDWTHKHKIDVMSKAGLVAPIVEMRILNEQDEDLPHDGKAVGELVVRGPTVIRSYYNNPINAERFTKDGWFRTGDVANIDPDGVLGISDRSKDLIKSGGEWISSVEMENLIMSCPGVLEAAVVARPDPRWDERPVAFVVGQAGKQPPTAQEIVAFLARDFAKWQLPSAADVHYVEQIPRTSVGKFDKKVLRHQLAQAS